MSKSIISKILFLISLSLITAGLVLIYSQISQEKFKLISPVSQEKDTKAKILDKYTIENLKLKKFPAGKIILNEILDDNDNFSSRLFYFYDNDATVSGLINIPKISKPQGIIILLRGYVDQEVYQTGIGTKRMGEFLSENGFITLSPDFLGYGKSSSPSVYPLEERFQTYTTALSLLASLPNLPEALIEKIPSIPSDFTADNIGLFGHSNGGHITLTVLEITGQNYPTVLWAPVSKPFPYSILYYTDEFEDKGKSLRKLVADFEKDYQSYLYSIDEYFDYINAPLQIHQGKADQEVPVWWSDELVEILKEKNKKVEYFTYLNEDHNFNQGSWNSAASRNLNFFRQHHSTP
ncbi:hypothetical protein A2W14_04310 [Candidatus Gottesmanbacteria bacterium RBG_16_37_8]|uniref:Peptidase S9 prolyl oligopeptidase catalytic domain-containing protein n=1 Tax=Candidatus Gottesmanbacteria bacterium RBG_16_37_8 TaxID=1798371 RepID=A0A1F5YS89_9BACT|nr:MAG: hypothetical protein A2W14_04310 [Candidatus Gottesmanbacteria bacterium RBG_16_37_8]